MDGSNGQITNRQLYEALMEIQQTIADIRVAQAGLPCNEHARAMDGMDTKIRDLRLAYKAGDQELKAEIARRQILWTGGGIGATLAALAGWLGLKG